MANKLGAAFLRCSLGPLNYAGGCILSTKFEEGLSELSADNLHGGMRRGIEETAKHVGVSVADVERLLPMADVSACAGRLDAAQKQALAAWKAHAGHLGGLMKGVADLTVDGRAPDVSAFLARLAKKVVRDRPLAEPLEVLSIEVASWLDLIERCADLIGDGDVLTRAYRRRVLARAGLIAAAGIVSASAIAVVVWVHAVRARVDVALAAADPCAVTALDPGDLARASSDQERRAGERRAQCEEAKRREAEARAAEEKRAADAREAERRRHEHEAQCAALAAHLGAGSAGAEDAAAAGSAADLVGRIAKKQLASEDLAVADLPCEDTPSAAKIGDAYAVALVASTAAWVRADDVSERARAALVARKDALPSSPRQVLAHRADRAALKALASKEEPAKQRAERLCTLSAELGVPGGKYCKTLFVLAGKR